MTPVEWFLALGLVDQLLLFYLALINVLTFFFFGYDKLSATLDHRRVREKVLWFLSLIGGSVGAIIATEFFRHKRRKHSFMIVLVAIFILQLVLAIYFFVPGAT